jgi:hypothetical protein
MKTNTTHNKHSFFDNNNNNGNNNANINEMRLLTEVSTRCAKWKSKCHSRSNTAFTSPNKFYKHSRVNSNVNSNSNGNGNQQKKEMERKCNTASKMCRQKKFRSGNAVNVNNKGNDNSKKYNTISNRSKCNKGKSGFILNCGSNNTNNTKITKTSLIYPSPSKHVTSISFVTPTINTTIKQLCNNK